MGRKLYSRWLISGFLTFAAAIIIYILSQTVLQDLTTVNKAIDTNTEAYLSFNTNYAKVGSALVVSVHNLDVPENELIYSWTVGSAMVENNHTNAYTPTTDDLEKFITVEVSYAFDQSLTATLYCSKLPVIYINTADDSHVGDEYIEAYVAMQGSSEYNNDNTDFYFGDAYIKLRGNSTKDRLKKPYKLKLNKACDLFGMGLSKHWVLLANDIDHTHIRNKLVYDFSKGLGMSYAASSLNVVLIFNNEYQGIYQLCEQVRIDENRIDIFDWEALAKEAASIIANIKKETSAINEETSKLIEEELSLALAADLSWISAPYTFTYQNEVYTMTDYVDIPSATGGFLLEMDFYSLTSPAISQLTTNYSQPLYFSSPEYAITNKALYEYADKYIQTFEYALHSEDFFYHDDEEHFIGVGRYYDWNSGWVSKLIPSMYSDEDRDGVHYSSLFDMESLVNNWIICEFTMNWDSMKNSVFISKDINGPAKIGPVWDFDWAFGNTNMYNVDTWYPETWHTTNDYFTIEQYYQSVQWNRYLVKDPYFLLQAYLKYKEIRPTLIEDIIKAGGELDTYYTYLKEAGAANDSKWYLSYGSYNGVSFEKSMDNLREFMEIRIAWLDEQFADFDTFVASLDCYTPSEDISVRNMKKNSDGTVTIIATVDNPDVRSISFQLNGTKMFTADVLNGTATITTNKIYSSSNIVVLRGMDNDGEYISGLTNYYLFGGDLDE